LRRDLLGKGLLVGSFSILRVHLSLSLQRFLTPCNRLSLGLGSILCLIRGLGELSVRFDLSDLFFRLICCSFFASVSLSQIADKLVLVELSKAGFFFLSS